MSTETFESIAIRVRQRLGLPEIDSLNLQPLVELGLRKLATEVGKSQNLDNWLQTDPATTTATLDADGVADLTALIASPRIILEVLTRGDVFPPAAYADISTQPFRFVPNPAQLQLSGAYDSLVFKACLIGTSIRTKSPDGNITPLAGDISFSVTFAPTLAQLPDLLVERLVDTICELRTSRQPEGE